MNRFLKHSVFHSCESEVVALRCNKEFVDKITSGQLAGVLLDKTCFYAEQGGQIYDEGFIIKSGDEVRLLLINKSVVYFYCRKLNLLCVMCK